MISAKLFLRLGIPTGIQMVTTSVAGSGDCRFSQPPRC